jgi:diguanylate cyclase (GGDEF)-like protein
MDLDNFKHINDTMGHSIGDSYIQFVAKLLGDEIKTPDVVVRLSGDQFAFLIHTDGGKQNLYEWFGQLLQIIRNPWNYNDQKFVITGSLGVAFYPEHGEDFSTLMQNSDIAMFYQKEHGKDGYTSFETQMFEKTLHNIILNNQLKEAIERNEFILHYQPQFDLTTGKILGVEALIRWRHPDQGFISPAEFIPFSEQTGQIIPISEWVLKEALRQKLEWESKGYPHIKMAINFSGYIFNDKEIFDSMCKLLREMQINPDEIEIEVTETAVMMELEKAKHCLHKLKNLGISIAMDDFGSGYSSLNYLQMLPFDVLKIDKEFIKNIKNEKETHIYQMVVDLAHKLGLSVVAEGIETEEQKEFLISHNCDIGQGYFLSRPVVAQEIECLLMVAKEDYLNQVKNN